MKLNVWTIALTLGALASMTACQKEDLSSEDASSPALSSTEGQEMGNDIDAEAAFRLSESGSSAGCPVITWSAAQGTFPNTMTIDFGDGCTGYNGRTKKGQIVVDISGPLDQVGSTRVSHTVDFYVDDFKVEANRSMTVLDPDDQGREQHAVEGSATVTDPDGKVSSHQIDHLRVIDRGEDEASCLDDEVTITGSGSGTTPSGATYTSLITTALVKPMACRWPASGVVEIESNGRRGNRSVDFGDGTCDDKAVVTLDNGDTREITIRRRR